MKSLLFLALLLAFMMAPIARAPDTVAYCTSSTILLVNTSVFIYSQNIWINISQPILCINGCDNTTFNCRPNALVASVCIDTRTLLVNGIVNQTCAYGCRNYTFPAGVTGQCNPIPAFQNICSDNATLLVGLSQNFTCPYGCDNSSLPAVCIPSPQGQNFIFIGILIFAVVAISLLWRKIYG